MTDYIWDIEVKGGEGSGHHGHRGRPGQQGGSLPRVAGTPRSSFHNAVAGGKISEVDEMATGTSGAYFVRYEDGSSGIMKFVGVKCEVFADKLDDILGFDLVPETILSGYYGKEVSIQSWVKYAFLGDEVGRGTHEDNSERLANMAVLDYILVNHDRHGGNYLFDDAGKLWAIDHELIEMDDRVSWGIPKSDAYRIFEGMKIPILPDTRARLTDATLRQDIYDTLHELDFPQDTADSLLARMDVIAELGYVPLGYKIY